MSKPRGLVTVLSLICSLLLLASSAFAQETTGGLQGTVKDTTGAVVSHAQVNVTGTTLVGNKELQSDARGYYHFANLPPGTYALTVKSKGFSTFKREGLVIEVGHLPTVDVALQVGSEQTTVEVSAAAPLIDLTTETTQTNITSDIIKDVPHGRSFQSVIQFAPSARNEPLMGGTGSPQTVGGTGTGGQSPGNGSNGQAFGFSVAGGADSENSYLVEGQETADSIGGFSHSNVPFEFIQEVQVKSSGINAEHGGALGGVVNVIMDKGSNAYHGAVFSDFELGSWDGSPTAFSRYDPAYATLNNTSKTAFLDPNYQQYQGKKDKFKDIFPGFRIGGPILKDKVWFFAGFNPEFSNRERSVFFNGPGVTPFSRNQQTYYTNARIDAALSERLRVFGSWLYQYQRENGQDLPFADSITGLLNPSSSCFGSFTSAKNPCASSGTPAFAFAHNLGYAAPNTTTNFGADFTITPQMVATVRWGMSFQNYHDFGFPTNGNVNIFQTSGAGSTDSLGNPIPSSSPLSQTAGFFNVANNINNTVRDATHHNQLDGSLAWFKSGWLGTHNFKFGYQLNHLSNDIFQRWNEPAVNVFAGAGNFYVPQGSVGAANCLTPGLFQDSSGNCAGKFGYATIQDFGSLGKATSVNHGFFVQDDWTIGHGITINAGLRIEKEYLPAEQQPKGGINRPINFGWSDKLAPRLGAAWDVFRDGRMKVFGSYGVFNDIMKLNLAISSFGGQFWQNCAYAMNTDQISTLNPVFASNGRFCVGPDSSSQANFPGGVGATPPGFVFLENQNFRTFPTTCSTCTATEEGVAPGLKPYRQHESVFGVDYEIAKNLAFEARWDRRRLDHAIEDTALFNPAVGETFVIVNPGQGLNKSFDGFWNFLYGKPSGCGTAGNIACPPNFIRAARSYDGLELRLTKTNSRHWMGMFSYTYSNFRGNYSGLTSSDISDGGGGRNSPNNSRSFDEPFFSYGANGNSSSGPLATDRPSAFKGYAYYELGWKKFTTDIGLFQFAYSGTPQTSVTDVGFSFAPPAGAFLTDIVGRGNWVDVSQDPTSGAITTGSPRTFRAPWFTQSDLSLRENFNVTEGKTIGFSVTTQNLFNQRAVTAYYPIIDSQNFNQFLKPGGKSIGAGLPSYAAYESPYNLQSLLNKSGGSTLTGITTINSQYGKPYLYQLSRSLRLGVSFTF